MERRTGDSQIDLICTIPLLLPWSSFPFINLIQPYWWWECIFCRPDLVKTTPPVHLAECFPGVDASNPKYMVVGWVIGSFFDQIFTAYFASCWLLKDYKLIYAILVFYNKGPPYLATPFHGKPSSDQWVALTRGSQIAPLIWWFIYLPVTPSYPI